MLTTELRTSFRRISWTITTWHSKNVFHNSSFIMKRMDPQLQFWFGTAKHAKKLTNRSKLPFYCTAYIHFFQCHCKQPTTAKIPKMFIAQKSYCACRVLSLATIGRKYYFNFILNRTRSGRELFDRPSYILPITLAIVKRFSISFLLFNLAINLQNSFYYIAHHTLNVLLHYLAKSKLLILLFCKHNKCKCSAVIFLDKN